MPCVLRLDPRLTHWIWCQDSWATQRRIYPALYSAPKWNRSFLSTLYQLFKIVSPLISSYLDLDSLKHFFLVLLTAFLYVYILFIFIMTSKFSRLSIPSVLSSLLSPSFCVQIPSSSLCHSDCSLGLQQSCHPRTDFISLCG